MLDNLRDQSSFVPEEEESQPMAAKPKKARPRRRSLDQLTGMTATQRFILAAMLLFMVLLLGLMFLFLAGKMVPSFF